jgi:co-chaperonin GroES (HSP10)
MALNIKPLSDRVLNEPVAEKTASGILFRYSKRKPQKELSLLETEQNTVKIGDLFLRKICWN